LELASNQLGTSQRTGPCREIESTANRGYSTTENWGKLKFRT
jgi:hypothetical protein